MFLFDFYQIYIYIYIYADYIPSIAFRHLLPNSARTGYATEGALFISAQLSNCAVGALSVKGFGTNETAEAAQRPSTHVNTRRVRFWEREREWMNEWMNKLYFTRVVEKTRGLFTSSPGPWGKLLLTKDTMSYSMLSTCTFIQTMLKWTSVNRETSR